MLAVGESDVALLHKAIDGDADAFGVLYERYLDAIYRYVYFRLGNRDTAQDVTEQVFLKAWEALPRTRFRGDGVRSWLYRIAHNAVVDYQRRDGHEISTNFDYETWESEQPAVLDSVIRAEEVDALAAAVAQLPVDQQQVVILRFIEGLDHADVADVIDKSPGACRVLQHRALKALGKLLSNWTRA